MSKKLSIIIFSCGLLLSLLIAVILLSSWAAAGFGFGPTIYKVAAVVLIFLPMVALGAKMRAGSSIMFNYIIGFLLLAISIAYIVVAFAMNP